MWAGYKTVRKIRTDFLVTVFFRNNVLRKKIGSNRQVFLQGLLQKRKISMLK